MLTILNYALLVSTSAYAIYLLWQIISWIKAPIEVTSSTPNKTKVSIIIPCRNEEDNIGNCLQSVLLQNYSPSLIEIIVADDHSDDKTREVAEGILKNCSFSWKYLRINNTPSNKKKAIEAGIAAANGELIVITDGDCTVQKEWISSTVRLYEQNNCQMICGPVAITGEKGFCEKFQSLEFTGLSILAGAGIFSKRPLLANGANIAYTKSAFERVGGFNGIDASPTGDDTLLLFKINKEFPGQVGYMKNHESIVYTQAQHTWKEFLQQRIRWASKGFHSHNSLNSFISLLVFITNFLLFIYCIYELVDFSLNRVFINCLIVKFTVDFLLLTCATDFFKKRRLLLYFLAGEFVTMAYISWVGLTANFSRYHWKGRDY